MLAVFVHKECRFQAACVLRVTARGAENAWVLFQHPNKYNKAYF